MEDTVLPSLERHFGDMTDPRMDRTKLHTLLDILMITNCAVITGADNWKDVEKFGKARLAWLQMFLELPIGIPSMIPLLVCSPAWTQSNSRLVF